MKLVFLDESGFEKSWKESVTDQPFHVLGGLMIDSQSYFEASELLRRAVNALGLEKLVHPLGQGFEIKAKEIARGTGWWKNNEDKRNGLRELMLSFPQTYDGTGFLVIIDKEKHLSQYAFPDPPHEVAFQFMFERLQWKLKDVEDEAVCVYDQTKFLDDDLHNASMGLMREGSQVQYWSEFYGYVSEKFKIDRIKEFYLGKSNNTIGLQVADYLAIFGYHYFRGGCPSECGWWKTIVTGLYNKDGNPEGYGLKVFP